MKFTEECVMCMEKYVLVKKKLRNGLNCLKKVDIMFKVRPVLNGEQT